ncbi:MAG: hypothetical protein P0120_03905 [Nitrospira sp.]|nr:hypothetical protein [Nitrospira sp.]
MPALGLKDNKLFEMLTRCIAMLIVPPWSVANMGIRYSDLILVAKSEASGGVVFFRAYYERAPPFLSSFLFQAGGLVVSSLRAFPEHRLVLFLPHNPGLARGVSPTARMQRAHHHPARIRLICVRAARARRDLTR